MPITGIRVRNHLRLTRDRRACRRGWFSWPLVMAWPICTSWRGSDCRRKERTSKYLSGRWVETRQPTAPTVIKDPVQARPPGRARTRAAEHDVRTDHRHGRPAEVADLRLT